MIDLTPVFYLAFIGIGAAAGLVLALLLWPIIGLGWWTFALPSIGAIIVVMVALWGEKQ